MTNRSETLWDKSNISLLNYQKFINKKADKYQLTIIDLFYISNFKGGNSTINESEELINKKLLKYSEQMREIDSDFGSTHLKELSNESLNSLCRQAKDILKNGDENDFAIDGFKSSFIATLLHVYFPNLLPILDRRLLINLGLVEGSDLNNARQVKNIGEFYERLIRKFYDIQVQSDKSIREIDREFFIIQLPDWATKPNNSKNDE